MKYYKIKLKVKVRQSSPVKVYKGNIVSILKVYLKVKLCNGLKANNADTAKLARHLHFGN